MSRNASTWRNGFTLIEILVGTAILAALTLILIQITHSVANAWRQGIGNSEVRQNERALEDFIGQELSAAMPPLNRAVTSSANLQFQKNPSGLFKDYLNPSAVFWQAPLAMDDSLGDLAEIGYFVRWITSGNSAKAILCRFFVNPCALSGTKELDPNYLIYKDPRWVTDDLLEKVAPATEPEYVGLFAENVIGFWVRCFDSAGNEVDNAATAYDSVATGALPASVEVSLVLLDGHSADRVTTTLQTTLTGIVKKAANGDDCLKQMLSNSDLKAVTPGARAYTTRVFLKNSR